MPVVEKFIILDKDLEAVVFYPENVGEDDDLDRGMVLQFYYVDYEYLGLIVPLSFVEIDQEELEEEGTYEGESLDYKEECIIEEASFQSQFVTYEYAVGSGPEALELPELETVPECTDKELEFTIESYSGPGEEYVHLDELGGRIEIESEDFALIG